MKKPELILYSVIQRKKSLKPSLAKVVAYFKYQATVQINRLKGTPGERFWQRNYYEHIIRNTGEYERICKYIEANPRVWVEDSLHPDASPNPFNRHHQNKF